MVLNLITFASLLHKQASILGSHELILNELEKYFTVNIVEYQTGRRSRNLVLATWPGYEK